MGDGTGQNPYTREDVLRLIAEHGGTAKGLNLSKRFFEAGIDLSGLNLPGIILKDAIFPTSSTQGIVEGANLRGTHFEGADFTRAHLERAQLHETHLEGAILLDAHLEGAYIWDTHLEGAILMRVHLQGANLMGTKFSSDIKLQDVDWGNYVLDEEIGEQRIFEGAVASYRHLKMWYTNAGMYDTAAEFYYREMEAKRKHAQVEVRSQFERLKKVRFKRLRIVKELLSSIFNQKDFGNLVWLWIYRLLCGYGERPHRVIRWAIFVVVVAALVYQALGTIWNWQAFLNSLYFSAISFTAVGYGSWVSEPNGLVKALGVFEAAVGVFSIALFLVTFTRKMTR
ncbi:MAG: pentapeptide repeat-containing protein [Chloroflexi bacterium]|nr:pentapeptide repeat-containing protein [Chloroflexota bacterium]